MTSYTIIRGEFPCQWCDKAKAILEEHELQFAILVLDSADLIMKQVDLGWRTVPMILSGDQFIGGFSELEAALRK